MKKNNIDNEDLPNLLQKGYFWLRCSGLHPKTLIDLHPMIVVVIGTIFLTPLVATAVFSVYEVICDMRNGKMTDLMENIPLTAGLAQVKVLINQRRKRFLKKYFRLWEK